MEKKYSHYNKEIWIQQNCIWEVWAGKQKYKQLTHKKAIEIGLNLKNGNLFQSPIKEKIEIINIQTGEIIKL